MAEEIKVIYSGDSSELQAETARARKTVEDYHDALALAQKRSYQGELDLQRALAAEVSGQAEVAQAIRDRIRLNEEALSLSKRSNITEQQAIEVLQKRYALEKQVAAAKAAESRTQSLGKLDDQVKNLEQRAALERQVGIERQQAAKKSILDKLDMQVEMLEANMKRGAKTTRNYNDALLQFAYAADDAQYGLRGLGNNIPGLALSAGATPQTAGIIALIATAAAIAAPLLEKAFGQESEEQAKQYAEAIDKIREKMIAAASARGELAAKNFIVNVTAETEAVRKLNDEWERNIEYLRAQRSAAATAYAAQDKLALAQIASANILTPAKGAAESYKVESQQELRRQQELIRAQQDRIALAQHESDLAEGKAQGGRDSISKLADRYTRQTEELRKVREKISAAESAANSIAGAQEQLDKFDAQRSASAGTGGANTFVTPGQLAERARLEKVIADLKEQSLTAGEGEKRKAAELKKETEGVLAQLQLMGAAQTELDRAARSTATSYESIAASANNEKQALQDSLNLAKQQVEATQKRLDLAAKQAQWERIQAGYQWKAERDQQQRDLEKDHKKNRVEFRAELLALQYESNHKKAMAEALRNEIRMRSEAHELAEKTGATEAAALRMVRRRHELEKEIERGGVHRSKVGGDRPGSGLRRSSGLRPSEGLMTSEQARRQRERRLLTKPQLEQDKAEKYWQRQLDASEGLLKVFQKFGVV